MENFYYNAINNNVIFGNNLIELNLEKVGGKVFLKNLKNKKTGYIFTNSEDNLPIVYIPGFDYENAETPMRIW